ncbi:hypothetical protein JB92DRAFT_908433 [Gautieria morchelliformis]|nr:hypothetical protein JB92DRAFT_908433 [Gautieria morchelliformis]
MAKKGMVSGMPTDLSSVPPPCEHCILGKQAKQPVPKVRVNERAGVILNTVYSDITGPEDVPAGGKVYVLNFIDDHSRQTLTGANIRSSPVPSSLHNRHSTRANEVKFMHRSIEKVKRRANIMHHVKPVACPWPDREITSILSPARCIIVCGLANVRQSLYVPTRKLAFCTFADDIYRPSIECACILLLTRASISGTTFV